MTNADGWIIPFQISTPGDWLLAFPGAGPVEQFVLFGHRTATHYSSVATFVELQYLYMTTKIVKRNLSGSRLTAGRKRHLEKLSRRPDDEIDTSDIPKLTEKFWQNAVRNPFYRPVKQQLTLRLDADIIAWLRRQGSGYQTRANALLRDAMLGDLNAKRGKGRNRPHAKNPRHDGIAQSHRAS
jgi:uncharacterized protein (DUF4415 family)